MNNTIKLLDAFKAAKGITSDNQAAIALDTGRQTVSNWRTKINHASPAMVEKMAMATGEDPLKWALQIEADRTKNGADKKAWLRWSQRVAAIALTVGALTATALPAQSNGLLNVQTSNGMPIVSNIRRWLKALYGQGIGPRSVWMIA